MNADEQVEQVAMEWLKTTPLSIHPSFVRKIAQHCARIHLATLDAKEKELEQLRLGVELLEKAVRNYEATNSTLTAKLKRLVEVADIEVFGIANTQEQRLLKAEVHSAYTLLSKGQHDRL